MFDPHSISLTRLSAPLFASMIALSASAARAEEPDHIVLGAGGSATPVYQGAKSFRLLPVPAIDIKQGPFFVNLRNGIGVTPYADDMITVGASATFLPGYRGRDAPYGIGQLSDGVGARLFANLKAAGFIATIGATKGVFNGTKGLVVDASISYPILLSSELSLTPALGATWADDKHMSRYFGVNAYQSLISGLPRFQAGAGVKDISGTLTASYRVTDRITVSGTVGVTTLLGAAQDSPLTFHKTQPLGFLTLTYRM
ncbi:MipA/OmpV family protein [Methylosinus sp. H3A]|uniref:MipA/OmpV family protein n=1 Tax=Methylosinus sp. H3A TaxID=2785786 RepID=UPI0018C2D390|nr:MipA/OmpV family protein [Methylosinus sp. H3A]MBG0810320.1 MipA/OmpV family protein [Methylosinus sp. H3A]